MADTLFYPNLLPISVAPTFAINLQLTLLKIFNLNHFESLAGIFSLTVNFWPAFRPAKDHLTGLVTKFYNCCKFLTALMRIYDCININIWVHQHKSLIEWPWIINPIIHLWCETYTLFAIYNCGCLKFSLY